MDVGTCPLQVLVATVTLSQPEGQIMPTTLLLAPPDFQTILRPCKLNSTYVVWEEMQPQSVYSDVSIKRTGRLST